MFKNLSPGLIGIRTNMSEGLKLAKVTGFEGLELDLREASTLAEEYAVEYVKDLWAEAGVLMGGWKLPVDWIGTDTTYHESMERLVEFAKLAATLGCHRARTVVPGWSDERTFKENWDFHIKRLRPVAEVLKDYGHWLGLEFIGPATSRQPHKYLFIHTMDAMLGLAASIGTGNIGLLFDTWHWYTCHATLEDVKKLTPTDIVYVHISDAPAGIAPDNQVEYARGLPAETGVIPLGELMRILNNIGYNGPVTPEPFSQKLRGMSPMDAAKTTAESLDQVWERAGLS